MIGEVAAVLSAISALNSGIATLKEGKGNLDSIVGKWAEADEQYRDVEKVKLVRCRTKTRLKWSQQNVNLLTLINSLKMFV